MMHLGTRESFNMYAIPEPTAAKKLDTNSALTKKPKSRVVQSLKQKRALLTLLSCCYLQLASLPVGSAVL